MKAITLHQPWATLVAIGAKRIETRSWRTGYRGPLAIHAGKHWSGQQDDLCWDEPFRGALWNGLDIENEGWLGSWEKHLPMGCIVAVAELLGCVDGAELGPGLVREDRMEELAFGDIRPGRWCWVLGPAFPVAEPVPVRGQPGLWPCDHIPIILDVPRAEEGTR